MTDALPAVSDVVADPDARAEVLRSHIRSILIRAVSKALRKPAPTLDHVPVAA